MLLAAQSLVPVILMIAVGVMLRQTDFVRAGDWDGFERVAYFVFFPALVIDALARADLRTVPVAGTAAALVAAILGVSALLLLLRRSLQRLFAIDGPAFTSVFQGAIRWNTFVALALATSLAGARGVTMTALAIVVMIPLLNVLAVSVLSRFAGGAVQGPRAFLVTLGCNPFIWSSVVGIVINLAGNPFPAMVMSTATVLGKAALPCGLVLVGAGLDLKHLARPSPALAISAAARLLLLPSIAAAVARTFGLAGPDLLVVVICTAVPTANSTYILARRMGGDAPLMAAILTGQTLLAVITLPLMIALLG